MDISSWFQSTTDCPEPGEKATDAGGLAPSRPVAAAAAAAGVATPATTAAAATKAATFPFLRMLMTPRDPESAGAIGQQGPGHGGAGPPANTTST
jgi:hypothetical protein